MPRYDFQCEQCGFVQEADFPSSEIESRRIPCADCGSQMQLVWLPNHYKPFPSFKTKNATGQEIEVTSLQQIRRMEKESGPRNLCWEPGSYDSHYGEL